MNGHRRTRIIRIDPIAPDEGLLAEAAAVLARGGLVAFPTETVYGLGADATSDEAVASIFEAKGRPQDNPLIVHVCRPDDVRPLVRSFPPEAWTLMEMFWPGPLTLVLEKSGRVSERVSPGLDTVAVRMPRHNVALGLIRLAGVPVAAPSANASGRPSPTDAAHVIQDLYGRIDLVVDGGPTGVGVESTVLDLTASPPTVLRPGGITVEEIASVLGEVRVDTGVVVGDGAPKSPGMKYRHYAPKAKVYLVEPGSDGYARPLKAFAESFLSRGNRVGIMATAEVLQQLRDGASGIEYVDLGSGADLAGVAARLFGCLRKCDDLGLDVVLVQQFPLHGMGLAVMNRLIRASEGKVLKGDGLS